MRRGIIILLAGLLLLGGCAVKKELTPAAPSSSPAINVEQSDDIRVSTDWSKLDYGDKPLPSVGSRWYDEYTGYLILRDDYGPLIPYAGLRLMADWPASTGCLYGLMTTDGVVVTDAVYSEVTRPFYNVGEKKMSHPLLALCMGIRSEWEDGYVRNYWAIAASDGSWCTDFCYRGIRAIKDGLLLFEDYRITYMSPTGEILNNWSMAELGLAREEIDWIFHGLQWGEGWFGLWYDDYFCLGFSDETHEEVSLLHLPMGQKATMACSDLLEILVKIYDASQPDMDDFTANLPAGISSEITYMWDSFSDDGTPALITVPQYEAGGAYDLFFLYDGTPLPELTGRSGTWYYRVRPVGGLIEVLDLNTASYYNLKTMDCVFRTYLGYIAD